MDAYKENLILKMTLEYAISTVEFAELLQSKRKYVIADQILKSGCSIGANANEAQNAESRADFIHKMKIAAKEADENRYWLTICKLSKSYPFNDKMYLELENIIKVLNKIIGTSKRGSIDKLKN